MFRLRTVDPDTKKDLVDAFGGNDQVLTAVRLGLDWLRDHQAEDGRWSLDRFDEHARGGRSGGEGRLGSDAAATGLALLSFLGDGHTHLSGDYQETVAFGLAWLIYYQQDTGELSTGREGNARMYSHGIATIALCEAYGMTRDERLRAPAQAAVDFIVAAQHRSSGGWRYHPNQSADTSVVGWQVMALKSAQLAGLVFPQAVLDRAGQWIRRVEGRGNRLGRFAYQRGHRESPAMTAEAILCLEYLGTAANEPSLLAGAEYLLEHLPELGEESSYYWYYGTQSLFHMQGSYWSRWNAALRDMLLTTQRTSGPAAGTWDPRDNWEVAAGRLYATALRLLMLEVYYRHLPLYQVQDPAAASKSP
jgi:hypothetical protein